MRNMKRRKSKRRSSSLAGGLAAAMREGHRRAGSDGHLPLVGNAASPPHKSWTRGPNSGFWFALVISGAIVAVANLAGGGGGPSGAAVVKARIVDEDSYLSSRIGDSHDDGTSTATTTAAAAVTSSAYSPAAASAEAPQAATVPLEDTSRRTHGGGSAGITDVRSGETSAAEEEALQTVGGAGAALDPGTSASTSAATTAAADDAELPRSISGEFLLEGDTGVEDYFEGAVQEIVAADVGEPAPSSTFVENQGLSAVSLENAKSEEEEEHGQAGDGEVYLLTAVEFAQETVGVVAIDSVGAMETDVARPPLEGRPTTAAEKHAVQLPTDVLSSCRINPLWEILPDWGTGATCPASGPPPPAPPLSRASADTRGGGGHQALAVRPVNPGSPVVGGRDAGSVVFGRPEDQPLTAVKNGDAGPAAPSALPSSSETATIDTTGGWERCQALLPLPWYQDALVAAAPERRGRFSFDACCGAAGGFILEEEVLSTTESSLLLAQTQERPTMGAAATAATGKVPPSCSAILPTEEVLAGAGAGKPATCRWPPPVEDAVLADVDVEARRSDEAVSPIDHALPFLATPEVGESTERRGSAIAMPDTPKDVFLPWGTGDTTCEMVLQSEDDSLERLLLLTSPEVYAGDPLQQEAVQTPSTDVSRARAPVRRPGKAAAISKGTVDEDAIDVVDDDDDDDKGKEEATTLENPKFLEENFLAMTYQRHDVCTPRSPEQRADGMAEEPGQEDDDEGKVVEEGVSENKHGQEKEKEKEKEREKERENDNGDGDGGGAGLEARVKEFNAWLASVEFPVRKVMAGVVESGMRLGAVATDAVVRGEPYLSVPGSIVLDASKARDDPELGLSLARLAASLSPQGLWQDDEDSLRILLIREKFVREDRSPWAPYLALLPTPADMRLYHPLFFTNGTIAGFKGSDVEAALRQRRDTETSRFSLIFSASPEGSAEGAAGRELVGVHGAGWITLERYLWATAILESRCIWWDGQKHLVPLLDLVNNAQAPQLTLVHETVQDSEGNAVTVASQDFDEGEQVLEDYGHPNHVLLLVHGFSLGRENSHDCVRIDAQRPSQEDVGSGYWEMLTRMETEFPLGRPMFCISLRRNGPYDFVSYARIMAGLPPTLPEHHQQQGGPVSMTSGDRCGGQDAAASADCDGADGAASSSIRSGASSPEHERRHARSPSSDHDHSDFAHSVSTRPAVAAAAPSSERDQHQRGRSTTRADSSGRGSIPSGEAPAVHRRWEALRDDPEGLRVVLDALAARLEGYGGGGGGGGGTGTAYEGDAGSGGDLDGVDGGEAQGDSFCMARDKNGNNKNNHNNNNNNNNQDGGDLWTISVAETTQLFLESEKRLLRELYDYLAVFLPPAGVPFAPRDQDGSGISQNNGSSSSGGGGGVTISSATALGHAVAGQSGNSGGCASSSGDGDITTTAACGEDVVYGDDADGSGSDAGGCGQGGSVLGSCGEDCGTSNGEGGGEDDDGVY
eukprot:g7724.t1